MNCRKFSGASLLGRLTPTPGVAGALLAAQGRLTMKRGTTWLTGLAAMLMLASSFSAVGQAHEKHVHAPGNAEWLQRPLKQTQANPADQVEFARIQSECLQTSAIHYGPQNRWTNCHIGQSAFVATIGLQDFFYANYCLIGKGDGCAKHAQVLFRNRAYRPEAFADMVRIDPPGTRYESPLLVGSETENVLATAVLLPGKEHKQRRYFRYVQERWVPIDGKAWLQQLHARLPAGLSVRVQPQDALPDPITMMLSLPLYRGAARAGSVDISLAIQAGQLELTEFNISRSTQ